MISEKQIREALSVASGAEMVCCKTEADLSACQKLAREKNLFLYIWSRDSSVGTEEFVILSSDGPSFEPSLKYQILFDPTDPLRDLIAIPNEVVIKDARIQIDPREFSRKSDKIANHYLRWETVQMVSRAVNRFLYAEQ